MARNRKTHSTRTSDLNVVNGHVEGHSVETLNVGGLREGPETSTAPEGEKTINVPSEVAQEMWESLRDEFYEQIEQLPLSLHRSFVLIGEQDREVQACIGELLPTIRAYVKLRQSIHADAETPAYGFDFPCPDRLGSTLGSPAADPGIQSNPDVSEEAAAQQPNKFPESMELPQPGTNSHKDEDLDISIENVLSRRPCSTRCGTATDFRSHNSQSPTKSSLNTKSKPSSVNTSSHSAATRSQGLRETDATVPKSVPFPPRPKPKTTRELLTRISILTREQLRASEEKVGLATAAYDSVDRHVRALDAAIGQYQDVAVPDTSDSEHYDGGTMQKGNGPAIHEGEGEGEGEDDDEPQLGMIGPLAESAGSGVPRLRRSRKRNRRNHQNILAIAQPLARAHALSTAVHQELPIDPYEPRYCYCNQVSYGEVRDRTIETTMFLTGGKMIACDNGDCSREWFHLGCAGLSAPPKGKVKWYCRDCEELLGNNKRRRIR